ncbi:MAG: hypothetical protein ACREQL_02970 [Candidatus Binatia bacterium]
MAPRLGSPIVIGRLRAWLTTRSERELRLLGVAAVVAGSAALLTAGGAVRDDLARRHARVAGLERELAQVRRLAETLAVDGNPAAASASSTLARLQTAAEAAGLGERIAAMTPAAAFDDGGPDDRVTMRLVGPSLADTVRFLHALEIDEPALRIARFALHKHPDDATRFDLVLEGSQRRPTP